MLRCWPSAGAQKAAAVMDSHRKFLRVGHAEAVIDRGVQERLTPVVDHVLRRGARPYLGAGPAACRRPGFVPCSSHPCTHVIAERVRIQVRLWLLTHVLAGDVQIPQPKIPPRVIDVDARLTPKTVDGCDRGKLVSKADGRALQKQARERLQHSKQALSTALLTTDPAEKSAALQLAQTYAQQAKELS